MKEVILKVPSLRCHGCENSIKEAFYKVNGIVSIEPSYKTKSVKIVYSEDKITVDEIIDIIKKTRMEVER